MSEVQKTSTWCLERLYSTDGMNRTWDGGVALAKILEILPCNNNKFFPASCFLSALVVLVLSDRCGFHDIFFSLFSFYNCAMRSWFRWQNLISWLGMWRWQPSWNSALYNTFWFNVLRQIMNECMTTILINKELDDKNYECGNPEAWVKQERI